MSGSLVTFGERFERESRMVWVGLGSPYTYHGGYGEAAVGGALGAAVRPCHHPNVDEDRK